MFPANLPGDEFINSWYPILIALALGAVIGLRNYMRGPRCQSNESAKKKIAIVTGASNGIGKETAQELAFRGCRVILACRNEEKAKEAKEAIIKLTKNKKVEYIHLDLASFKSIREFVEAFTEKHSRLDILINNAAVMSQPFSRTEDGNELHFQTNYLGHFLLTNLLLDTMKSSAPSRIINLVAPAYGLAEAEYFDDPNFTNNEESFTATKCYSASKLSMLYFTQTLSRQLEGSNVTCNAVLPGIVNTDIYKDMPFKKSAVIRWSFGPVMWFLMKTSFDGAQMPLYLAIAKEEEGVSGKLFREFFTTEPSELAKNQQLEKKLYKISVKLTGVGKDIESDDESQPVEERKESDKETESDKDKDQ